MPCLQISDKKFTSFQNPITPGKIFKKINYISLQRQNILRLTGFPTIVFPTIYIEYRQANTVSTRKIFEHILHYPLHYFIK